MKFLFLNFIFLSFSFATESCGKVKIFIKSSYGRPDCSGSGKGHSGIGIEDEYYDYGPISWSAGKYLLTLPFFLGIPGDAWYDNDPAISANRDAKSSDIIKFYSKTDCPALYFEITTSQDQITKLKTYWDYLYNHREWYTLKSRGWYTLWGKQCTSTVFESLVQSGIIPDGPRILFPLSLYKRLREQLVNTCGKSRGKPPKIQVMSGKAFWSEYDLKGNFSALTLCRPQDLTAHEGMLIAAIQS